ncbi:MAG: TIR domain-containing protein [Candidatus Rokubacteria bacterium]|nr:TIR domain-containing protein [Candidatus Rokubacteria bacterium]
MARRVFFSFHYDWDIFRANQVRNANVVVGPDLAGYFDHSEYDEAKRQGDDGIRRMILRHLDRTTVTVVLIGTYTAIRPWVRVEIAESIKRQNGLLGIFINHLSDHRQMVSAFGPPPAIPPLVDFPTYPWDGNIKRFADAIEAAGKRSDALRNPPPLTGFRRLR